MTIIKLSSPRAAENPASGMISSEGIGGKTFSANIKTAMPSDPISSKPVIQSDTIPPLDDFSAWHAPPRYFTYRYGDHCRAFCRTQQRSAYSRSVRHGVGPLE